MAFRDSGEEEGALPMNAGGKERPSAIDTSHPSILPSMPLCIRCRGAGFEVGYNSAAGVTVTPCILCKGAGCIPRMAHQRVLLDLLGLTSRLVQEVDEDGEENRQAGQ